MDNSTVKLLMLGGAGVAVWWFYLRTPETVAAAPVATGTTGSATTGAAPVSLDAIHEQLVAAAKAPSEGYNADEWNYFLTPVLAKAGKGAAPDPAPLFAAAITGWDRQQPMSIAQYWAVMAPALKTQFGLSGLGIYGGLAGLAWGYR